MSNEQKSIFKEIIEEQEKELGISYDIKEFEEYNEEYCGGKYKDYFLLHAKNRDSYIVVSNSYVPRTFVNWPSSIKHAFISKCITAILFIIAFTAYLSYWALLLIIPAFIYLFLTFKMYSDIFQYGLFSEKIAVVKKINQNPVAKAISKIPLFPSFNKEIVFEILEETRNDKIFKINETRPVPYKKGDIYILYRDTDLNLIKAQKYKFEDDEDDEYEEDEE